MKEKFLARVRVTYLITRIRFLLYERPQCAHICTSSHIKFIECQYVIVQITYENLLFHVSSDQVKWQSVHMYF